MILRVFREKRMRKNRRTIRNIIAVLVILMMLLMTACSNAGDPEQAQSDAQNTSSEKTAMVLQC